MAVSVAEHEDKHHAVRRHEVRLWLIEIGLLVPGSGDEQDIRRALRQQERRKLIDAGIIRPNACKEWSA